MKRSTKILALVLSVLMLASVLSVFSVFADAAELAAIKEDVNLKNLGLASYHEGRHAIRVKFSVSPETPQNESVIEFGGIVRKNEGTLYDMLVDEDGNLINPTRQAKYTVFKNHVQTGKVFSLNSERLMYTTYLYDLDLADHLRTKYSFIGYAILQDSEGNRQIIYTPAYSDISYNRLVCLDVKNSGGCIWDEGVITTLPTHEEAGSVLYTCDRCWYTSDGVVTMPEVTVTEKENQSIVIGNSSVTPAKTVEYVLNSDPSTDTTKPLSKWYADYVVSFNNDIASATDSYGGQVALFGSYGSYGNVPMSIVTDDGQPLTAGEEYPLLVNLAEQYAMPNWADVRYSELAAITPFTCGAVVLDNIPDGTNITISLVLYEDADRSGRSLTICENTYALDGNNYPTAISYENVPTAMELNTSLLGIDTIDVMQTNNMTFETTENPMTSDYRNWHADFTVSFNKDIDSANMNNGYAGQVILYGDYGDWGAFGCIPMFIVTEDGNPLPAGTEYRLLPHLAEQYGQPNWGSMKYGELETWNVSPFNCGTIVKSTDTDYYNETGHGVTGAFGSDALGSLPAGTTITVSLKIYEVIGGVETGRSVNIESHTFALS